MLNKKEFTNNNTNKKSLYSTYIYFSNIVIRDSLKKYFKKINKKKELENLNDNLNKLKRETITPTNEIFELIKPKYFTNKNNEFSNFSRFHNLIKKSKVNKSKSSSFSKFNMNNSSVSYEDEKNSFITKKYYPNISNYNLYSSLINNNYHQKQKKRENNSMNIEYNSKKKLKKINIDLLNKSMIKLHSNNMLENKENKEIKNKIKNNKFKNKNEKKNSLNIVNLLNNNIKFPKSKLKPKTIFDIYEENKHLFKNKNQILKILKNNK